jgi:hypothetical protein
MRYLSRWVLGLLLVAEAVLVAIAVQDTYNERQVLYYESAALVVFVAALALLTLVTRNQVKTTVTRWVVLGFGAVLQLIAIHRPPVDSDDDFRYLWDGKVQLAGIDPYRYAPSSPGLTSIRDTYLFPSHACPYPLPGGGCTRINLPTVHTIYPPVAEGVFTLIRIVSFGRGNQFPLQLAAALGALVIAFLLSRRGRPLWTVALWAWCPVTVLELGSNAHIDWLAVLLTVLALTASARGRLVAAGVLLGAGFATKLYPGLLGVVMLKRRRWYVVVVAAVATVVLVYVPHVVAVGTSVVGYLPTYLNQGGYGNGHQYRLLALVLPTAARTPVAVVIVVALIGWALLRTDPEHPERTALIVMGTSILVVTPTLPWYTLLLLALAALAARPEWLGVVAAPTIEYLLVGVERTKLDDATAWCYLVGLLILLIGTGGRRLFRARALTPIDEEDKSGITTRPLSWTTPIS